MAGEEVDDEHEQELCVAAAVESTVPLQLPDALGVALSGNAMKEEEEHDMGLGPLTLWCCGGGEVTGQSVRVLASSEGLSSRQHPSSANNTRIKKNRQQAMADDFESAMPQQVGLVFVGI